jgi:hypothetical protein
MHNENFVHYERYYEPKNSYYDKLTYYVPKNSYEHKKKVQNIFCLNYFFGVILNNTIYNHL